MTVIVSGLAPFTDEPSAASRAVGGFVVRAWRLTKRFFGVTVLDGVSLSLAPGEIHALIGENDAEKLTLINLLSGALLPDGGWIVVDEEAVHFRSPVDAQKAGIVTIHREFGLFPNLTVAEALQAGHLPTNRFGLVDWCLVRRRASEALDELGIAIDVDRRVASLSVAERKLVEIARALTLKPKLIIMNEPTAALGSAGLAHLKAAVRCLADSGVAFLFISRHFEDVVDLCQSYSVLRDGRFVLAGEIDGKSIADVVRAVIGRDAEPRTLGSARRALLTIHQVRGATGPGPGASVLEASLRIRSGEIVALVGLAGAGRTELARLIFGLDPLADGEIWLDGLPFRPQGPLQAIRAGVGFMPDDRKQQELFLELSAGSIETTPKGWSRQGRKSDESVRLRKGLKLARLSGRSSHLPVGNPQTVALACWLELAPRLLIVDEPTRGLDIDTKEDVYGQLRGIAEQGTAVLVIFSDLSEAMAIANRIIVMRGGRTVGEVETADADEEGLLRLMSLEPSIFHLSPAGPTS